MIGIDRELRMPTLANARAVLISEATRLSFEYRTHWNSERCHQGIEGRTPAERADGVPAAKVLKLSELRRRQLVRRSYAHGLLNGYTLEPVHEAA
jgi:hypothetical protein